MYDMNDPNDRLTMAVLEYLDYAKEHFPLTTKNVEIFARGFERYTNKIEVAFQNYFEKSTDSEEEKGKTAQMIDAITKGTNTLIKDVLKELAQNKPKRF